MPYQEQLTDVPADRVEMIRSRFQAEGATVEVVPQSDGNFTVIATFQNAPWAGRFAPANAPQAAPPRTMKSPLETKHPGFDDLIAADVMIERVAGGLGFTEGPVWRGGALLFSDIPNKRIARWRRLPEGPELTTFTTGHSNGLTLDGQGRLLAAEHGGRCVSRIADNGSRTVLADKFDGKRLNSPNDIIVKSDGTIYFTDPPYALQEAPPGGTRPEGWYTRAIPGKELTIHGVYRLTADGTLHLVADDFALPNGLAFSPDESILYVADSAHKHIRAFDVASDGSLKNSRILVDMTSKDPGVPDGMKLDVNGNIFSTGPGGIWVCRPDGTVLGHVVLPELPANVGWGEDGSVLFATARTSVYRIETKTRGALLA
jgi:gluconolactonase